MNEDKPKEVLHKFCRAFIESRASRIRKGIADIQESLTSETKSSAGDKHETGRAMLQLEREKLGQQLAEVEKMGKIMARVSTTKSTSTIGLGSLINTTGARYYLSISAGEHLINGQSVFCISSATSIGKLLLGKKVGDIAVFNGVDIRILQVT